LFSPSPFVVVSTRCLSYLLSPSLLVVAAHSG
jgi:hypothetical protein